MDATEPTALGDMYDLCMITIVGGDPQFDHMVKIGATLRRL